METAIGAESSSGAAKQTTFLSGPPAGDQKSKRGRKKGVTPPAEKIDGATSAHGLLEFIELFAVAKLGPGAQFTPTERLFIEPSLAGIIERYGSTAQQFSFLLDPAMLIIGAAIYGTRLAKLVQDQNTGNPDQNGPAKPPPAPPPPAPPAKTAPDTIPVSDEQLFSQVGDFLQGIELP
jgi:hypothetical protein